MSPTGILIVEIIKMKNIKHPPIYIEDDDGNEIEIISIENYVTPEEEYANELFDEYEKRNKDVPNA